MEIVVTNTQLYLSIVIPTLAVVLGCIATSVQIARIKARMDGTLFRLGRPDDWFDSVLRH
jgi:hypothetical protein